MTLFNLDQLRAAQALVYRHMPPTPQFAWPLLGERLGAEVWVKHENHTPTGAFKVRGGLIYLDELTRAEPDCPGIITSTRGNHGQSIPFAARAHGMPVFVLCPTNNSVEKVRAMRGWGAQVELFGEDYEDSRQETIRRSEESGLHIIGPFHEPLVRGVATYALEFFEAAPDLDVVYVPVGMGSGICGLLTVRDLLGLKTRIVGVVSAGADAYALSFEAGKIVEPLHERVLGRVVSEDVIDPATKEVLIKRNEMIDEEGIATDDEAAAATPATEAVDDAASSTPPDAAVDASAPSQVRKIEGPATEPIDLMEVGGSSIVKRAAPAIIALILILLLVRRRRG